jgi:putative hydrolase of the HAD superfamily
MIDWSKIHTVFLDLDGTLLDLHFDNHFWLEHVPKCYAEKHRLALHESHKIMAEKYRAAYGSLNWYCVDYWTRELDMDIGELKQGMSHKVAIRPHVEEFLEALHMHGKRVVLVTNAHPVSIEVKMKKTNLNRFFHRIITSHELHHPKEAAEFWRKLEAIEPVDKSATLFIDDNFTVLDAARKYGIEHLLAIRQPDSTADDKEHHHYHLLNSFLDVMPY